MSEHVSVIDALFPSAAVLEPYFGDLTYPDDPEVTWADGMNLSRETLALAEPLLRALGLAGYRALSVHLSAGATTSSGGADWIDIDLLERTAAMSYADAQSGSSPSTAELKIQFVELFGEGNDAHGVGFPEPGSSWALSDNGGGIWSISISASVTEQFKDCISNLSYEVHSFLLEFVDKLKSDIASDNDLGLFWLFNPDNWFPQEASTDRKDLFLSQLIDAAALIWEYYFADDANSSALGNPADLVDFQLLAWADFDTIIREADVIGPSRSDNANRGEKRLQSAGPDASGEKSPLGDALKAASYFDLIAMMIHTKRIMPPRLDLKGLVGHYIPPQLEVEALRVAFTDEPARERQVMTIFLYDQVAAHLILEDHPKDNSERTRTPPIQQVVAWEYLGESERGAHGIGLTLGRGVKFAKDNSMTWPVYYEIFRAQSQADFRRPIDRPADYAGTQVHETVPVGLFDDPDGVLGDILDHSQSETWTYTRFDDTSATAAQRLEHDLLRSTQVHECFFPETLKFTNLIKYADNIPGLGYLFDIPTGELSNYDRASPPALVLTHLDGGAVRFEWYEGGFNPSPGSPPPDRDFLITLTPKDPSKGDFGFIFSLDYGLCPTRPFTEDTFIDLGAESFWESLTANPNNAWSTLKSAIDANLSAESMIPFGRGFFRLWYSGDVEIDIERISDSDTTLLVEMMRVTHALDLPEQGTRLPSRNVTFADYVEDFTTPGRTKRIEKYFGLETYQAMFNLDDAKIPDWLPENMPEQFLTDDGIGIDSELITPVGVAETHVNHLLGLFVPKAQFWSDTRWWVVRKSDLDRLEADGGELSGYDRIINGNIKVDPTGSLMVVQIFGEVAVGFIPFVGTGLDAAEFFYALSTGQDKWGEPVPTWQLVLMGVTTFVPGVSSGMIKAGKRVFSSEIVQQGATLGTRGSELMGMVGNAPLDELRRLAPPFAEGADDIVAAKAMRQHLEESSEHFSELTKDEQLDAINHALGNRKIWDLAERAGSALGSSLASLQLKFDDLLDASTGTFRNPWLENAYQAAVKARKADAPELSRAAFIQSRKFTTGKWRVIFDAFELIRYTTRTVTGSPQTGSKWPALAHLDFSSSVELTPNVLAKRLRNPSQAIGNVAEAVSELDKKFITKHQEKMEFILGEINRLKFAKKLVGSKNRSIEEVIVVMARVMDLVEEAGLKAGFDLAKFIPPKPPLNRAATNADEIARVAAFDFFFSGLFDFLQKGVTRSGYQHGYFFEFIINMVLDAKGIKGVMTFVGQATIGKFSGPDFIVCLANGYAIIQLKAIKYASRQFGTSAVQDNMIQCITDMIRLSKKNGKIDPKDLPAHMTKNQFNGTYISAVDLDYLRKSGQAGLSTIFEMAGSEVVVDASKLSAEAHAKLASLVPLDNGFFVFNDLDSWLAAARHIDKEPFDDLIKSAMELQAADIQRVLEAVGDLTKLQNTLTRGTGAAEQLEAKRVATLLCHIMNSGIADKSKHVKPEELMSPGGAQKFWDSQGLTEGWMELAGGPPKVTLMDLSVLQSLSPQKILQLCRDGFLPGTSWP